MNRHFDSWYVMIELYICKLISNVVDEVDSPYHHLDEDATTERRSRMHPDFIQIGKLEGELKISHKLRDLGVTVTTKELVIQKPHINYHIPLDQIISILPYDRSIRDFSYVNQRDERVEVVRLGTGMNEYKVYVDGSVMHNRSGIFHIGKMEFVVPIHDELLQMIDRYSELRVIR